MKSYTITVNGTAYEVTVEENGNAAAPVAAAPKMCIRDSASGGISETEWKTDSGTRPSGMCHVCKKDSI